MDNIVEQNTTNKHHHGRVHFLLLNSYLIFLVAVVLGAFLDPLIKNRIFTSDIYQNIGFLILVLGSILIYWAQRTSSVSSHKKSEVPYLYFNFGPYKYLRNPTHLGLFIVTLGFSLIINSIFGVILNIIAYLIVRFFFIKKEEELLEVKYGKVFSDYKEKVKNWI